MLVVLFFLQDIYSFMQNSVKDLLDKLASKTSEVIRNPFQVNVVFVFLILNRCVKKYFQLGYQMFFFFSKEQLNICFMQPHSGENHVIKGLDVTVSDLVKTHGHHTLEAVKKVPSN